MDCDALIPLTVRQALLAVGLAPIDAQVLLAHVLGRDRAWLVGHRDDVLPQKEIEHFIALAKQRREQGEPIAYLVGRREFHGLDLAVTRDVLIPRPETETLVEQALIALDAMAKARAPDGERAGAGERQAASNAAASSVLRVLDLGTGSGAIALAIAHARPRTHVTAVDRSPAALDVARDNAARLAIANVEFVESDWYGGLREGVPAVIPARACPRARLSGAGTQRRSFDLIVANPPYIAPDDPHLAEGDLRHEPREALTPGGDGLSALRRIVAEAPAHLVPGGWLAVEHGYDQGEAVRALFAEDGFSDIRAARDLAGIPRVVTGRLAPS